MSNLKTHGYVAIRKNDKGEYINLCTLSYLKDITIEKAKEDDRVLPKWAKDNQVVRIAYATIIIEPENQEVQ